MAKETILLSLVLAGCAGAVPYGSFLDGREAAQRAIAADAAERLWTSFPAEGQTMRIAHDSEDAFGRGLASELRKRGFAIRAEPSKHELLVRYVVDAVKRTNLLRATIYVQGRTLSRAYAQRAKGVHPVGPWSVGGRDGGS